MLIFRSEDPRSEDRQPGGRQPEDRQPEDHIGRWCRAWRLPHGEVLSVEQTWKLADAWYRDRMSPDWRRRTVDEAHALFRSLGLTSEFWRFS